MPVYGGIKKKKYLKICHPKYYVYAMLISFQVSLQRRNETRLVTRGHRCEGALVTLRHVVIAASCTRDIVGNQTSVTIIWLIFATNT